jgi:hypothetical protein
MKVVLGFILGGMLVLLVGAVTVGERVEVWGSFEKVGIYRPTFSGITPEGNCYLAVTNTITGQTEIFGIPAAKVKQISDKPLQTTSQGTFIVEISR